MSRLRFALGVLSVIFLTGSASAQLFPNLPPPLRARRGTTTMDTGVMQTPAPAVITAGATVPGTTTTIPPITSRYTPAPGGATPAVATTTTTMPGTTTYMPSTTTGRRLGIFRRRGGDTMMTTPSYETPAPALAPGTTPYSPLPKVPGTSTDKPGVTIPPSTVGSATPMLQPTTTMMPTSTSTRRRLFAGRLMLFRGRYAS